ncbi:MAG: HD domain-containing protein [Nanoarchaeota archaeon]|nr:HD domain-containing protein [Nanoarchaeota archaeon]
MTNEYSINAFWNLPEVKAMRGQMQNEWHRFDVYKHTKKVYMSALERNLNSMKIIVASMLHDIGKIPTAKISQDDEGNIRYSHGHACYQFPDHAQKGKEMILAMPEKFFSGMSLNQENIADIVGKHHMVQKHVTKIRTSADNIKEVQRCLENLKDDFYVGESECMGRDLLEVFYSDSVGKGYSDKIELEMIVYHMLQNNSLDQKRLQKTALKMHKRYDLNRYRIQNRVR